MADNRGKSGRDGTPPLWANMPASAGLTFNTGSVPSLLMPVNNSVAPGGPPLADTSYNAGEEDSFMGQSSQPVSDANQSSIFDMSGVGTFQVGYGSAPPSNQADVLQASTDTSTSFNPIGHSSQASSQPPTSLPMWNAESQHPQQNPPSSQAQMYNSGVPQNDNLMTVGQPAVQGVPAVQYTPINHHWFYCKKIMDQDVWTPFSYRDAMALEDSFLNGSPQVVATDGGRYDVNIDERTLYSVYWKEGPTVVQRCSWFHRDDVTMKYIPYDEDLSEELEEMYMNTVHTGSWHKRNEVPGSKDLFVIHSPGVIVQFSKGSFPDEFGATFSEQSRPKVVKRGVEDMEAIQDGETTQIDHLIFVVHGIGPVCDLKFRGIVECVDDMRSTSTQILNSHFKKSQGDGRVGRVEFLPIYWHDALRNDAVGVERRLQSITLPSVKRLRQFTNEVLLDILFYNSPLYSQSIVEKVGTEINRLYTLFMDRNPQSTAEVSLAGHSLGSLVLFDLLSMQGMPAAQTTAPPPPPAATQTQGKTTPSLSADASRSTTPDVREESNSLQTIETLESLLEQLALSNLAQNFHSEQIDLDALLMCSEDDLKSIGLPLGPRRKILKYMKDREKNMNEPAKPEPEPVVEIVNVQPEQTQQLLSRQPSWLAESVSNTSVTYVGGTQGIGLPLVDYPQLCFKVTNFFALGSPIAMFLTIRGVDHLSRDFTLPTCKSMFNIFHPFDPVAYRIEPMINPDIQQKPKLMPHHKGRKRLHLELKENLTKVGADLKERLMRSLKSTWTSINDFAKAHSRSGATTDTQQGQESELEEQVDNMLRDSVQQQEHADLESVSSVAEGEVEVGQLNQGRRIDYMLQESPLESFNDYLFSIASHLVYWESEDVSLMLMKEVYNGRGILPDEKKPSPAPPPMFNPSGPVPSGPPPVGPPGPFHSFNPPMNSSMNYPGAQPSFPTTTPPMGVATGPPPTSGFVPGGPPPRAGFMPRHQ